MNPSKSVEEICELIKEYQLTSSKDYAAMRARWFRPDRKDVADAAQFCRWLVMNKYVTEFVAKVLSGRKSSQLVLNQYRLVDQLHAGPMKGAYLAIDALDRHVAIEVLAASSAADKTELEKFQQAAHNAMQVQHVNVGRILDTGEAHGFHYLVEEFYEGQTLEEILQRRKTMPYQQAARLMALAFAGLEALHSHGVPVGDLTANCLFLTHAGKDAPNQRTVKILHAGVKRKLFDEAAIGHSIRFVPGELELSAATTFQISDAGAIDVADDIFRLGSLFYRALTGHMPFEAEAGLKPLYPAKPVCQLNPEVPEMLGQMVDEMIDPDPQKRPTKASHVAKALRVFLAADEHSRETKAEENISLSQEGMSAKVSLDATPEVDAKEDEAMSTLPSLRRRRSETPQSLGGKLAAVWDELRPENRDLVCLAGGAVGILLIILLIELLAGLRFIYIAGLVTGAAFSYFVEIFAHWRQGKQATD